MTTSSFKRHSLTAPDSHDIPVYLWEPQGEATAIFQLIHGLGEHSARYERFAIAATGRGYAVCVHDHRGHGPHSTHPGYFAAANGWELLVTDSHLVTQYLRRQFGEKPIVLLGHSMGSYIAQSYAMRYADALSALILSGSTWPSRLLLRVGRALAQLLSWRHGKAGQSPVLDKIFFGDFNKRFAPARTELDWLSREPAEVDKYIDDPLCGGPYTTGLWIDLFAGLLQISTDDALRKIPSALPILITGGGDDPVGGADGMNALSAHYTATGHSRLTTRIYAEGRHEMLNETNRDKFTDDLLQWTAGALSDRPLDAE